MSRLLLFTFLFFILLNNCGSESSNTVSSQDSLNISNTSSNAVTVDSLISDSTVQKIESMPTELSYDYTAKYICPARCKESGNSKSGSCKNCGMDLIENPNLKNKK